MKTQTQLNLNLEENVHSSEEEMCRLIKYMKYV